MLSAPFFLVFDAQLAILDNGICAVLGQLYLAAAHRLDRFWRDELVNSSDRRKSVTDRYHNIKL